MTFPFLPSLNPQGLAPVSATDRNHPVGSEGCALPMPLPSQGRLSDFKTIKWLSRGPGSAVYPRPCPACLFPSDLGAAAHWTHPSSSSGGEGSWWHQQGQAHVPIAACKAFPSPGRSLCLLSPPFQLSPTVCLWVYGWLWGLPKYRWRNLEHKDQFWVSINSLLKWVSLRQPVGKDANTCT